MKSRFPVFVVVSILLIVIDQLIKVWSRGAADGVEGRTLWPMIPGIFELKLIYNKGVAFGMMEGLGVFLTPIAVGIAIVAGYYSHKNAKAPLGLHITCALLASGAIGNLIDRLLAGKVTDMFWFRAINFPVFNFADVCISIAGAIFVLGAIKDMSKKSHEEPIEASVAD